MHASEPDSLAKLIHLSIKISEVGHSTKHYGKGFAFSSTTQGWNISQDKDSTGCSYSQWKLWYGEKSYTCYLHHRYGHKMHLYYTSCDFKISENLQDGNLLWKRVPVV